MTTEEKARAYEAALERAKQLKEHNKDDEALNKWLCETFLELAESEDERIRKLVTKIIDWYHVRHTYFTEIPKEKVMAWLEKQKELTSDEEKQGKEDVLWCINQAKKHAKDENEMGTCWFAEKWLEKQGEQKETPCDRCRKAQPSQSCQDITELGRCYLEHEGEQKTAGKVEPKYHEGDWVVYDGWVTQLKQYRNGGWINDQQGFIPKEREDSMRLWTIHDAKDGDVLATDNFIFIFKNIDNDNGVHYYCQYEISKHEDDNQFDIALPQSLMGRVGNSVIHYSLATKEQRELLFSEMKEAGYEWDEENKELKKIEQNPADNIIGEEKPLLEKFKQAVYDCAWGKVTCKVEGESKEEYANRWAEQFLLIVRDWADDYIDFTVQQKLRKSHNKWKEDVIKENSPAWSEEDEKIRQTIINEFEQCSEWCCSNGLTKEDCINWLNRQKYFEWSDEDNENMNSLCVLLDQMVSINAIGDEHSIEYKNWLNSLKERIN